MAYVEPNAADLQNRFPAFAGVDAEIVTTALGEAARMVDESWTEGDFGLARMLLACHYMTLDGHGATVEARSFLDGSAAFKVMRSGSLSLERFGSGGSGDKEPSPFEATSYGQRWVGLAKRNIGGPVVV